MIRMEQRLSFCGRYNDNLNMYSCHAIKRLIQREINPKCVERVVTSPECLHLPSYKDSNATAHLGILYFKDHEELVAVITNSLGKVITLYKDELIPRLEMMQKHYSIDLFEKLNVKKPEYLHKNKPAYKKSCQHTC